MTFDEVICELRARKLLVRLSPTGKAMARCPVHGDRSPSLSIRQRGEKLLMHCFAGCKFQDILMELRGARGGGDGELLETLCSLRALDAQVCRDLGWSNERGWIRMPYYGLDGSLVGSRYRTSLASASGPWKWPGEPPLSPPPYLATFMRASDNRFAVLVEGETDSVAGLMMGLPTIGIPGAAAIGAMDMPPSVSRVFYVKEPDEGGEVFERNVRKALGSLGPKPLVLDGAGDLSELLRSKGLFDARREVLRLLKEV